MIGSSGASLAATTMNHCGYLTLFLLMWFLIIPSHQAFQHPKLKIRSSTIVEGATGGWGIGQSRDMIPEEFARGDRKAFEGYRLTDRGEFMRQLQQDKDNMKTDELDELLGVAKMAGINVKNPSDRLNKFDSELLNDDEDLDLSV